MAKADFTAFQLREMFEYNPEEGVFSRKVSTNGRYGRAGAVRKSFDKKGYVVVGINGCRYFAHRLAWLYMVGAWPEHMIDHINGVKSDNRFVNLRDVSGFINQQNKHGATNSNALGILGVCRVKNRFHSAIWVEGKSKRLGSYKTVEEAQEAYLLAKRALHAGCVI